MAVLAVTNSVIPGYNVGVKLTALAALTSATDGAVVDFSKGDKAVVIVANANSTTAKTVTFKKGNGLQGTSDKTVSIPKSESHAFVLESGAYKQVSGTNKGKLLIVGESTDIQIQVIVIP